MLSSVAAQLINGDEVSVDEQKIRVTKIGDGRPRTVRVILNGREIRAIEQNRNKPSRWGKLARTGTHRPSGRSSALRIRYWNLPKTAGRKSMLKDCVGHNVIFYTK
jgi:hypothetical protein